MDDQTIRTYDRMAKEYDDETTVFWDLFPRTFLDAFANLVRGDALDVGSGPGRDGLLLKERGIDVTCLDASATMVRLCEEKGLRSMRGDFHALPFPDESFGGVWAYTSLLHVPKAEAPRAFDEIRRVLKDGGTFGLGMIEGETEGYRESSGIHEPRWFSFYEKKELEELLQTRGFEVIYFEQFTPGSKRYLNFIAKKVKR